MRPILSLIVSLSLAAVAASAAAADSGDAAALGQRIAASRLMAAVISGNPAKVQRLAPAAKGLTIIDPLGFTPLIWASAQRSPRIVELLLAQGHSPNLASPNTGWTPLMMAAMYGNTEAVDLLLQAGANPAAKANDGSTAESVARSKQNSRLADRLAAAAQPKPARGATP